MNNKKPYVPAELDLLLLAKEDIMSISIFNFSAKNKDDENEEDEEGKWYTPIVKY